MPLFRTVAMISLAMVLIGVVPGGAPARPGLPSPDATLPLLLHEGKAHSVALLVQDGAAGHFAASGRGIRRDDHFRAGSITKAFVATVVLQLAGEHALSLSDPVERHLPGLLRGQGNDGRRVTLRELLDHTSGLYDFTADTGGTVPLSPTAAVRVALSHPPSARGAFAYSNTDYVLLGMVIARVTGEPYAQQVRQRIIVPLHLTGTSLPGARSTLPAPHGRAYDSAGRDVTDLDPRVAGAAGELVSTLADLDRFFAALLAGRLLTPAERSEMLDTQDTDGRYGMGVYPVRLPCGVTVWGHNGRIPGSYVRSAATPDGKRVLTYRLDTDTGPSPRTEQALLSSEFCWT